MAKKWIQKAVKKMKKGSFREYCGGKVTLECIRRGKNSSDPTIRRRAALALALMKSSGALSKKAKAEKGGEIKYGFEALNHLLSSSNLDYIFEDPHKYKNDIKSVSKIMAALGMDVSSLEEEPTNGMLTETGNQLIGALENKNIKAAMELISPFINKMEETDIEDMADMFSDKETSKKALTAFKEQVKKINEKINSGDVIDALSLAKSLRKTLEQLDNIFESNGINPEDIFKGGDSYFLRKFAMGGSLRKPMYQEGGDSPMTADSSVPQDMAMVEGQQAQPQQQQGSQQYDITYEQFVDFVMRYPEYFKRLLMDLQQSSGMQQAS